MSKSFVICSDLHIREHEQNKIDLLRHILVNLHTNEELIIAGDLFDIFIGNQSLLLLWQKELLNAFKDAKIENKKIIYVEGNRDFFVSNIGSEYFYDVFKDTCYICNGRLVVIHGDRINKKDLPYRCWRTLVKNRYFFSIVSCLPANPVLKSVFWLERNMKKINKRYKSAIHSNQIERYSQTLPHYVKAIISGHFHKYIEINIEDIKYIALPCWDDYPNVLKVALDKDGFSFKLEKLS